jgi:hypothetical protein
VFKHFETVVLLSLLVGDLLKSAKSSSEMYLGTLLWAGPRRSPNACVVDSQGLSCTASEAAW